MNVNYSFHCNTCEETSVGLTATTWVEAKFTEHQNHDAEMKWWPVGTFDERVQTLKSELKETATLLESIKASLTAAARRIKE